MFSTLGIGSNELFLKQENQSILQGQPQMTLGGDPWKEGVWVPSRELLRRSLKRRAIPSTVFSRYRTLVSILVASSAKMPMAATWRSLFYLIARRR